ncbi:TPO5 [Candida theae]|uniref:TPO5 n=1 Tax=Candida theae TaxID=1198502 RepID=A0AAD5BFC2_9ASCO|nr:TPO5 [Candida theae]KAI5958257.1 TPO5 [Candida theae]
MELKVVISAPIILAADARVRDVDTKMQHESNDPRTFSPQQDTFQTTSSQASITTQQEPSLHAPIHHFIEDIQSSQPVRFIESLIDSDILGDNEPEHIEHFKYQKSLDRKLTVTSVIGLGFSLMGVPFGLSSTLWISLMDGANVTILYGWIIVSIMSLCVGMSLSEINAKFPTSGGVYHYSALLSSEKYSSIWSWVTGWLLLIGNWTYAVSIIYSGSEFTLSIISLKDEFRASRWLVNGVFLIILALAGLINLKFFRHLERINKASILWTIYTVLAIDILLIFYAPRTNSIKQILTTFDNSRSGWPDPLAFMVGLQAPAFSLTGYGMLLSISDEVKNAERNMPKGMLYSMLLASLTGLIFIIPILTILPELELLLDGNTNIMPIEIIFKLSTESFIISFLMACLLVGTIMFQSIGSLTTASRSTFALARDGGLPMAHLWTEVSSVEEYAIPKNALYLSIVVCAVLSLLSLLSRTAFNAFMGAAVVSLTVANGIPVFLLMLNKRQKIKGAAFRLGVFGWLVNGISVFWTILSIFILCVPPVIKNLDWSRMNYASVVLVLFLGFSILSYVTWGSKSFTGPEIDDDYFELNNMEATGQESSESLVVGDESIEDLNDEEIDNEPSKQSGR